jgi:hypothetical protein
MNIGDNLYCISKVINALSRNKIVMIDEAGIEWYRYDKPINEFSLETHAIVGRTIVSVEGTIDENDMIENSYFTDKGVTVYESDINSSWYCYWFNDVDKANTALKKFIGK